MTELSKIDVPKFHPGDIRFRLATARRVLFRGGCDSGVAGHVTVRDETDRDTFWTTPMDFFDSCVPTDAARMDFGFNVLEGEMPTPRAMGFHPQIYKAHDHINAIIHTHSPYIVTLSTMNTLVGMYNLGALSLLGNQALTPQLGEAVGNIAGLLDDKNILIMPHHGAIVVAPTLEDAVVQAIMLESAAMHHINAIAVGGQEITDERALKSVRPNPAVNRLAWDAYVRRLAHSDPDLLAYLATAA